MPEISNGAVAPADISLSITPSEKESKTRRFYKADDPIPWSLAILFGFQVCDTLIY